MSEEEISYEKKTTLSCDNDSDDRSDVGYLMPQQSARFLLYMKTGKCRYDIAKNKTGIRRKWHPFVFLIYDRSNDEILFSGKVLTASK